MTIDEAIKKERRKADKADFILKGLTGESKQKYKEECLQLAEWLEELKTTRIALEKANGYLAANWKLGYQKAIDNMVCSLIKNSTTEEIDGKICLIVTEKRIKIVAEQLKEKYGDTGDN